MNDEGAAVTAAKSTENTTDKQESLTPTPKESSELKPDGFKPVLVETEKMFEQLAEFTKETARKAFEYFEQRGGEFGKEFDDWFRAESEVLLPVTAEVTEADDKINIRAAVPGFKPEEIKVSVKDNLLILSGETESREKPEDENTILSEWRSNKFCRQFVLSSEVDTEKTEASLKDGVLQMTLPKLAAHEATQIPVNAG